MINPPHEMIFDAYQAWPMCLSEKLLKFCFISLILFPKYPSKPSLPEIKLIMAWKDSNEAYSFLDNPAVLVGMLVIILTYLYEKSVARWDTHKHQQVMQKIAGEGKKDEFNHIRILDRQDKVIDFMNKSFLKVESTNVNEITYAAAVLTSATGESVKEKDVLATASSKVPNAPPIDVVTFGRALRHACDQEDGFLGRCKSNAPVSSRES